MKLDNNEYYLSSKGCILLNNGYIRKYHSKRIVAHIPKELHKHILNEINSYYTDKDFKEVVDSVWGK